MASRRTPEIAPGPSQAQLLAALGIVLLVVVLSAVLTSALPPALLVPQWQLRLVATVVDNASLALLAGLLLHLALGSAPGHRLRRQGRKAFRRCTLAAAAGFLLLIPLQIDATLRFRRNVTVARQEQISQTARKLAQLRQLIASSTTHQHLQAGVQKLFGAGAGLSSSEWRLPIEELRPILLARASQASQELAQRLEARPGLDEDALQREALRLTVSSLAYAIGFAFLAGLTPPWQVVGRGRSLVRRHQRKA